MEISIESVPGDFQRLWLVEGPRIIDGDGRQFEVRLPERRTRREFRSLAASGMGLRQFAVVSDDLLVATSAETAEMPAGEYRIAVAFVDSFKTWRKTGPCILISEPVLIARPLEVRRLD